MRRSPMNPGRGFARPTYTPAPAAPLRPATRHAVRSRCDAASAPIPKDPPLRSEPYRRLVAAMPCASCRFPGPSQAAHANQGKGMAIKTDDRTCFPLCTRCHRLHDQAAFTTRDQRREMELRWGHQTRATIVAAGTWPKNLPLWSEKP